MKCNKTKKHASILCDNSYSTLLATVATNGTSRIFPHSLLVHLGIDYANSAFLCDGIAVLIHCC